MCFYTILQHRYYVPYYKFHGSFKVKHPASGAKMQVQYVTLARFCYVDIGMYCCVCITLLQVRIAMVHNSNIGGVSLKVNAVSCWKYPYTPNPTLNLPDSVNKCKSYIKMYLLMQPCYFNFLMWIWAVLLNRSFKGFIPKLFINQVQRRIV